MPPRANQPVPEAPAPQTTLEDLKTQLQGQKVDAALLPSFAQSVDAIGASLADYDKDASSLGKQFDDLQAQLTGKIDRATKVLGTYAKAVHDAVVGVGNKLKGKEDDGKTQQVPLFGKMETDFNTAKATAAQAKTAFDLLRFSNVKTQFDRANNLTKKGDGFTQATAASNAAAFAYYYLADQALNLHLLRADFEFRSESFTYPKTHKEYQDLLVAACKSLQETAVAAVTAQRALADAKAESAKLLKELTAARSSYETDVVGRATQAVKQTGAAGAAAPQPGQPSTAAEGAYAPR